MQGHGSSGDIVNNREAMAQPWDPDAPIRLLWSRLDKQLLLARNAKAPIILFCSRAWATSSALKHFYFRSWYIFYRGIKVPVKGVKEKHFY